MTLRVSIIGNGAIGGLIKAGCQIKDVRYNVLTRQETQQRLTVELLNGTSKILTQGSQAITRGELADVIIIPVKAYQVKSVIDALEHRLSPHTCLVMLHNGMGSQEIIQAALPKQPVVLATTSHAAYKVSDNYVKQTGIGQSQYGWLNEADLDDDTRHTIEQLLHGLLQPATLLEDMQTALWKKLAVNASINPLTAALRVKNGHLNDKRYRTIIEAICQEVSLVAVYCGQLVSKNELVENTYKVIDDTAENYSSMYQDILAQRKTEIDSISGYIVARATDIGQSAPENKHWFDEIKTLERTYL